MAYDYQDRKGHKNEGESKGQLHYDAQRNFEYCNNLLKKIEVIDPTMYWEIYEFKEDFNPQNQRVKIITEPKYILFYWEERGKKFTGQRNFQMPHEEFKAEMVDAINFFLEKRFMKRFGIPIGTRKMPVTVTDHKYAALFGDN